MKNKKDIIDLLQNADEDTIGKITEAYPQHGKKNADRLFREIERRTSGDSSEFRGDTVSGVERYRRSGIFRRAASAAACLAIVGAGVGTAYALSRSKAPDKTAPASQVTDGSTAGTTATNKVATTEIVSSGKSSDVFAMLDALDYHAISCDGLPTHKLTAPDGTVYCLHLEDTAESSYVWRRPSLIEEADNEAPLTDEVIAALRAHWDELDITESESSETTATTEASISATTVTTEITTAETTTAVKTTTAAKTTAETKTTTAAETTTAATTSITYSDPGSYLEFTEELSIARGEQKYFGFRTLCTDIYSIEIASESQNDLKVVSTYSTAMIGNNYASFNIKCSENARLGVHYIIIKHRPYTINNHMVTYSDEELTVRIPITVTEVGSDVFAMLDALDYHAISCDGLPTHKLTAPDGTVYYLHLSDPYSSYSYVWRRPSLIEDADNEAKLTDAVIAALRAHWDELNITEATRDHF